MWQEDKPEGLAADTLEEGWNTVGLVAAGETDMNGWWWRDERRSHTWGVHDSMRQAYVSISSPLHQVQPSSRCPARQLHVHRVHCSDGGKRRTIERAAGRSGGTVALSRRPGFAPRSGAR